MRNRPNRSKPILSMLVAVSMAFSLSFAPALASAEETLPDLTAGAAADETTRTLTAQAAIPSKYDLRSEGLVTPVKLQNPWNSCWAFGGIAAAETSILSACGTTYAESKLDLSERHLTYFALQPVTAEVNDKQVGEGVHMFNSGPNAAFNNNGKPIFITSLFSQGIGPVAEIRYPYRGKNAILDQGPPLTYSENDDWSIPEKDENGNSNRLVNEGFVLKDGNVLPSYWDADKTSNEAGKAAIKQELLNGHGVSIMYYADMSGAYTATDEGGGGRMYAQYIPKNGTIEENGVSKDISNSVDHAVCIVGWDDSYSVSNFREGHQPDASKPGAWIVKNSWGSETDGDIEDDLRNAVNKFEYGIKKDGKYTGYFYLSYEDATICNPESMEFSTNLYNGAGFYTLQHDYMPAANGFFQLSQQDKTKMLRSANVFVADEAMEVKSVSTRTSEENMRVTYAIYLIDDNALAGEAPDPTAGELAYRTSRNYEYAGFHRLDLDQPLKLEKGQRYSVVSTASTLNAATGEREYGISVAMGVSKAKAEELQVKSYTDARVNPGESYVYAETDNGSGWIDWSIYREMIPNSIEATGEMLNDSYPLDNFSIKVYAVPAESTLVRIAAQPATCTEAGCIEHWYDSATGKYYADADGKKGITRQEATTAALGHSWDAGKVTKAATAYAQGTRTYTCTRCGNTKTEPVATTVSKGKSYKVSGNTYKVTSNTAKKRTVTFTKAKNAKNVKVPATVKIKGATYQVTGIGAKAFAKAKKARIVTVKTKKLKKSTVKNCLKGSKVTTVKVKVGSKALNKKYVKKYKKVFTKKVCGATVTVK